MLSGQVSVDNGMKFYILLEPAQNKQPPPQSSGDLHIPEFHA